MKTPVSLYLRVRTASGSRAYVKPVRTQNQRLKRLYGVVKGAPKYCPEGCYHLRYQSLGKRIWERLGPDPDSALSALQRKDFELEVGLRGMVLAVEPDGPSSPNEVAKVKGRPIKEYVAIYLAEMVTTTKVLPTRIYGASTASESLGSKEG